MTNHIDLSTIHLEQGAKASLGPTHGCVMEWVARFNGAPEPDVSDNPDCTSPVLRAFAVAFNDGVDDETRQRLIPFIPRLVGTAGDRKADAVRAWLATDWLVRVFTPAWLRKAGLASEADALLALPELTGPDLARSAQPIIDAARAKASAAWAAAWDAARAAARDAARAAAWDAAGAAAGDAAGDAARAAARAAAWDAARAAAGDAAGDAARAAANSTKGTYDAKYRAARKAADEILKPPYAETITELRDSALALFERMIDVRSPVAA